MLFYSFYANGQLKTHEDLTEKKADSILNLYVKNSTYAKIAHDISLFFNKKKKYFLAIKYGKIEVSTLEEKGLDNNKKYSNALYNIGKFYARYEDYDNAILYYEKVTKTNHYPLKKAQSYCELGYSYRLKGDLYKSLFFFQKGIPLIKKHAKLKTYIAQCINFSLTTQELNTKESNRLGLFYLKKGDSIIQQNQYLNISKYTYPLNINLGNLYSSKKSYNYKKAKLHYLKNLNNAILEKNEKFISASYLNLGELYLKKRNDSSFLFFKNSIKFNTNQKNIASEAYRNLADYYIVKKDLEKALINIQISLNISFKAKEKDASTLSENSLIDVIDKRNVIRALKSKIEILIYLFKKTNNSDYLNKAINTVNLTDKLITVIIEYSTENNSHFLWRKEISNIYKLGVRISYLLSNDSLMFSFMEKNKAFLLTVDINNNIKNFNLPLKTAAKKLLFKKNILQLENEKQTTKTKDSLFNLKEKYTFFKDSIQKKHPQYTYSKKSRELLSLDKATEQLLENKIIVSYTLNNFNSDKEKTSLFGLLISNKKSIPFKIEKAKHFLKLLKNYKTLISRPLIKKSELKRFKDVSYSLYELLFPSKEIREIIKNKNVTIIPDIDFENIPFEALNTNKKGLNYLLENCNINYVYSFSFLKFNSKRERKTTNDFIGFAPIDFINSKSPQLKHSKKEIETIGSLLNGEIYIYNKSSKENFINKSSNTKVIHLATHATLNHNPSIAFYNKELKLHELYTYKNNADLVVLSACETNLGDIKPGEGVLSLARGFFYSGAKSVISSLWNVNDKSTTSIMTSFYKNLKGGKSKSLALTNAKREYINNHSLSEKSPYYWASFVLIGDNGKMNLTNHNYLYITLLVTTLIFFLFFYLKNKKRG